MECLKKKVIKAVEDNRKELIKKTCSILIYPTVMGKEHDGQMHFAKLLKELEAEVDIWEPKGADMDINPNFLAARDEYNGSPNVVGTIKGAGGGKSIMINGHMDVVPEGDNDWDLSPWSGAVIDGKIYGRGACDMKGGIMAGYMAVKAIKDAGIKLKGDVYIASVIGEETGGAGTLSLIKRGYKADCAIVPEPTDMYVCPANLGAVWFRIRVKGIGGHAADASNGINAVNIAADIIKRMEVLETERAQRVKHELYAHNPNPFCISVGSIKGGLFPTSIPDEVIMEGRVGYSPDEDLSDVKREFEAAVKETVTEKGKYKKLVPEVEWFGFAITSGGVTKDHPIVKTVADNYRHVLGKEPELRGTPWGTDAGALTKFGGTPAMIFGPGPGNTAHKANECVNIEEMMEVTKIIACTILDWCGEC